MLWTFQTGYQIAAGPTVYAVNGTEYIAIGVGGTTTSSSGGTVASQIQVFDLGGSQTQSTATVIPVNGVRKLSSPVAASSPQAAAQATAAAHSAAGAGGKLVPPPPISVQAWDANTSNIDNVQGHVLLNGAPVAGAVVRVDGWVDPTPTDATGAFTYPADDTMALRHPASVVDVSHATVNGHALTAAQQSAVLGASAGISVGYQITNVSSHVQPDGSIVLSGQMSYGKNIAPPTVLLYTYELRGVITDSSGNPVKGAVITTRTNDRQYWTQSEPSGANGSYASFLVAADQEGDNPVPMEVGVAVGNTAYAEPSTDEINFAKLQSSVLNIQLPATPGGALLKTTLNPQAVPGAIYQGLMVGVVGKGSVIHPISATWPAKNGFFRLVLPSSAAGQTVSFWQDNRQFFSPTPALPKTDQPRKLPLVAALKRPPRSGDVQVAEPGEVAPARRQTRGLLSPSGAPVHGVGDRAAPGRSRGCADLQQELHLRWMN